VAGPATVGRTERSSAGHARRHNIWMVCGGDKRWEGMLRFVVVGCYLGSYWVIVS
jgi:hypothetical protein